MVGVATEGGVAAGGKEKEDTERTKEDSGVTVEKDVAVAVSVDTEGNVALAVAAVIFIRSSHGPGRRQIWRL